MKAFEVSSHLDTLLHSYPDAKLISEAAKKGGLISRTAIARLWLSEGIPYAFKSKPALYEVLRTWLGERLEVDPKEIHLSGSARLGQSLAPRKIGIQFGTHSDLDLFIVSQDLFERVKKDFEVWSFDFENSLVHPKNERERGFWDENIPHVKSTINRGFIDSNKIPYRGKYSNNLKIAQSMSDLKIKLDITPDAPKIKSASVRCYKNWGSFVQQITLSLR